MNKLNESVAKKNRKLMNQSTIITLIGVVIMAGLSYYVISKSPSMKESVEAERPVERKTVLQLNVLEKIGPNKYSPVGASVNAGTQIIFDISSNVPVHVALLLSNQEQTPEILYNDARIPPGKDRHLEKSGGKFEYTVLATQENLKFCVVQAKSTESLNTKLKRLNSTWMSMLEEQCVQFSVN